MLRLAMVLFGVALIVRARRRKGKGKDEGEDSQGSDDSSYAPPGTPKPTLDPSIANAYSAPGVTNPFANVIPDPTFGIHDPLINPVPMPGYVTGGPPTSAQLSSANNMYNAIIGSIPSAIQQKIANVQSFAGFQARLAGQIGDFFGGSTWSGPPLSYRLVDGVMKYGFFDPKTGAYLGLRPPAV